MEQSQRPIEEIDFTCWWEGQSEADGKDIKAINREEAARMAVDIWRHENLKELQGDAITVFLKDPDGKISRVKVDQ